MRALLFPVLLVVGACASRPASPPSPPDADAAFVALERRYAVELLRRHPVVSTYLGGSGLDPSLAEADGRLRDHSPEALAAEDRWLEEMQRAFEAAGELKSAALRIDRAVALAQVRFLLHQHRVRRYAERAVDTYVDEPFRGVDLALQGMTSTGEKTRGTPEEWRRLATRLRAVRPYFATARVQLERGVKAENTADWRMLERNGLEAAAAGAAYFEKTLVDLADQRIAGEEREALLAELRAAAQDAAGAQRAFRAFVQETFFEPDGDTKPAFAKDRYALGEAEYDWALANNLHAETQAARLYEEALPVMEATRAQMIALAQEIGKQRGLALPRGPAAVRAVFDELSKVAPRSDVEVVNGYRAAAFRLVDYARRTGIFDVPEDYQLEVMETPAPLRTSLSGAAYYPAPPFKNTGVGRYYVTPPGNDPEGLKAHPFAGMADLSAHEGFPGHDWHYKMLTRFRSEFGPVRWLTPGAVEDSSSMWQDSMAAEGWGLYAEGLMAEPQPGAPHGFYTPEERLYQLNGLMYREVRVRLDTGLHLGRLTYDEAVDLNSQWRDFLPGSCGDPSALAKPAKRESCKSSEKAIFRYSKWPTQAITYRLGKDSIVALRKEAQAQLGDRFNPKRFHLEFMRQGTIPVGYFREELLRVLGASP